MKILILFASLGIVVGAAAFGRMPSETVGAGAPSEAAELGEITLPIQGMTCGGCAAAVNYVLGRTEGVAEYRTDYEKRIAWVRYDTAKLTPQAIVEAINEKTPFQASVP